MARIGIVASRERRKTGSFAQTQSASHSLYEFVKRYEDVLRDHQIVVCSNTAKDLNVWSRLNLKPLDEGRDGGLVELAAQLTEENGSQGLERLLIFVDPTDEISGYPEHTALIRNGNIFNRIIHLNHGAVLWAEHQRKRKGKRRAFGNVRTDTAVFIAHNEKKRQMTNFVVKHAHLLENNLVWIGTKGTAEAINEALNAGGITRKRVRKIGHGPAGGDVRIAREILTQQRTRRQANKCYHVCFFMDHHTAQPHEPDIQVLLRVCAREELRVNLMMTEATAIDWIKRHKPVVTVSKARRRSRVNRSTAEAV